MLITVYQLTWSNISQHLKLQQHAEITSKLAQNWEVLYIRFHTFVFTRHSLCHYFVLSVQQSSFYGYTSMLPSRYTQAVMAGESKCRATCNDNWWEPSPLPLVTDKLLVNIHRNCIALWQQLYSICKDDRAWPTGILELVLEEAPKHDRNCPTGPATERRKAFFQSL